MGKFIFDLAEQMGGQAAAGAMGLFLGGIQDKRQVKQQEKLQRLQIAGNKEMLAAQAAKELQMWKDTSYPAQMEMLKKAGLNPGLIYGMGGAGGQTTGGGGGGVTGATATQAGGGEFGIAMQMGMMAAQKRLLEAQANNLDAQTKKTSGVDTQVGERTLDMMAEEIQNKKAQRVLYGLQARIDDARAQVAEGTIETQIKTAEQILGKLDQEVMQAEVKTFVDRATQNNVVDKVKEELAILVLQKGLITAQTQTEKGKPVLQAAEFEVLVETARDIVRRGQQKWRELELQGADSSTRRQALEEEMFRETNAPPKIINDILDFIILRNIFGGGGHKPVTGFGSHKK